LRELIDFTEARLACQLEFFDSFEDSILEAATAQNVKTSERLKKSRREALSF
jgi:hypothetical protein